MKNKNGHDEKKNILWKFAQLQLPQKIIWAEIDDQATMIK